MWLNKSLVLCMSLGRLSNCGLKEVALLWSGISLLPLDKKYQLKFKLLR